MHCCQKPTPHSPGSFVVVLELLVLVYQKLDVVRSQEGVSACLEDARGSHKTAVYDVGCPRRESKMGDFVQKRERVSGEGAARVLGLGKTLSQVADGGNQLLGCLLASPHCVENSRYIALVLGLK